MTYVNDVRYKLICFKKILDLNCFFFIQNVPESKTNSSSIKYSEDLKTTLETACVQRALIAKNFSPLIIIVESTRTWILG